MRKIKRFIRKYDLSFWLVAHPRNPKRNNDGTYPRITAYDIAGGYAYSTRAADHITFDKMTIVDVSGLIAAIENNQSLTSYFSQIQDSLFEVTGGYLDYMN